MWALLIPTIPITLIKNYTNLSYVSMTGIACGIAATILLISYCSEQLATGNYPHEEVKVFDLNAVFGHVGIAIFLFQRNAIVINVRAETKHRHRYPKLLYWAVICIILWYFLISLVSYFTFRSELKSYVTYNLIPDNLVSILTNLFFSINTLTSYPV